MSDERQEDLFLLGAQEGVEFLEKIDREDYKKIREHYEAGFPSRKRDKGRDKSEEAHISL